MLCITSGDTALALALAAESPTTKVSNKDETKWVEIKHDVRTADLTYDVNFTATKAEDYLTTNARRRETWAREDDRRGPLVMPVASDPVNYIGRHRNADMDKAYMAGWCACLKPVAECTPVDGKFICCNCRKTLTTIFGRIQA